MSHCQGWEGGGEGTDGRQRVAEGAMLVRLETRVGVSICRFYVCPRGFS